MAPKEGWRRDLYIIIFESDTKMGKLFDVLLLWAILISVFSIMLESDAEIGSKYSLELKYIEWLFTFLFTVEYLLRLICTKKPAKYAFSFFGIVDFVSTIPTYLNFFFYGGHYLLVIRAIRLLRVFRILKLARYSQESKVLMRALTASRAKITVFLGAVLTCVLIMGTAMYLIESDNPGFSNIFQGMYWAIVTMTTVGYGDIAPITPLGKFLASIIMIMGYGIIAVPTGIVSAELAHASRGDSLDNSGRLKCKECKANLLDASSNFCHQCGVEVLSTN